MRDKKEVEITIGPLELSDLQFAIQAGVAQLNATYPDDFRQVARLVNMWSRLEYVRTHDAWDVRPDEYDDTPLPHNNLYGNPFK